MMSSCHLGQYKGNFHIMDEVLTANLPPTKTPVTRFSNCFVFILLHFQIDQLWFAFS